MSELMKRHADSTGRHPIISAFVITAQADVPAILADSKELYHWKPIDETLPALVSALKRAEKDGVFACEYHGRDHKNAKAWTQALRTLAKTGGVLTRERIDALWPEPEQARCAMMTEYHDVRDGALVPLSAAEIKVKVADGLGVFRRVFGHDSRCTVAPKYLWGPRTEKVWREEGITSVHGSNRQGGPAAAAVDTRFRQLGNRTDTDLTCVPRTAEHGISLKSGNISSVASVMRDARRALAQRAPVVISTHSWAYCLVDRATHNEVLARLDTVLSALETEYPDLRYLTSAELAELGRSGRAGVPDGQGRSSDVVTATGLAHGWHFMVALAGERMVIGLWFMGGILLVLTTIVTRICPVRRPSVPYEAREAGT